MHYNGSDQYSIDHFNQEVAYAYDIWDLEHLYDVTNELVDAPADADFEAWNAKLDEFKPEPQDFLNWSEGDDECINAMYDELESNGWEWDLVDEEACYPVDHDHYLNALSEFQTMFA